TIRKGEPLFTFETEKSTLEFESPVEGVLTAILAPVGQPIPCLTPVAVIGPTTPEHGQQPAEHRTQASQSRHGSDKLDQPSSARSQPSGTHVKPDVQNANRIAASPRARTLAREKGIDLHAVTGTAEGGVIVARDVLAAWHAREAAESQSARATPVARRVAAELGVDLTAVKGTGPAGCITREDVERAAQHRTAHPPIEPTIKPVERAPAHVVNLSPARRVTAQRLAENARTAPHVTLNTEADATSLVSAREQLSMELGEKMSYNALLVAITARALKEHPYMNASWDESAGAPRIVLHDEIHIGLAVDTERGLYVPVVRDCGTKSLAHIHHALSDLIARAQAGRLEPAEISGGTFTITNLGMYEVDAFTPILNLPEAAILGVGRILPKPVAHGEQVVIRHMMTLSLTFDHRVVDGAPAARFLQRVKNLIERPFALLV
ncbi:MAG: dihydrolipoamide acetyltransferase family protein, partial [Anaerolineae bacterium]|nr:2-oxo acid dehydrogenase subunit E2 [Thermoflexales bacterium]MDW8408789.1 dihydrolipoamide acetyltransferase family protein [Anaerolineae bacterium]